MTSSAEALQSGAKFGMKLRKFSVGLTGGIGCGKTAVSDIFMSLGATVVDTDRISHALTVAGGAAIPEVRRRFGDDYVLPDGALDRPRMRELVFANSHARADLERILHPLITAEAEQAGAHAEGPYVLYVVPLLIESGTWRQRVSRILVVDCPEELQVARVVRRNGMTAAQVRAIMSVQASRQDRLAAADDVVHNDNELADLRPRVESLHAWYCELAVAAQ